MAKRVVALVVVLAFIAGGVLIVSLTGSDDSGGSLRKLPAASAGGTSQGETSSATKALPAVAGDMALPPVGAPMDIAVKGELPDLAGKATAYELSGSGGVDNVQALADLIGLKGAVTNRGDGATLIGPVGVASLQLNGMRAWSVYRAPPDANCRESTDNTMSCSGSGVATPAVVCGAPACAPHQSCPEPAKCVPPEPPARPADLPTKAEAEQAARDVLAKLNVDLTAMKAEVSDAFNAWTVVFTQELDGQQIGGLATNVVIGPKGAVQGANGFFARPVKLGDYPLAGTAKGLERLKAGTYLVGGGVYATGSGGVRTGGATVTTAVAPATAGAPIDRGVPDTPPPPPEPRTLTVTGVHLQPTLVMGADGNGFVVPAYVFELDRGGTLPPVAAVVDALLDQRVGGAPPAPTTVPPDRGAIEPMPAPAPDSKPAPAPAMP